MSAWPRIWRRMRSSPRSSSGPSPASPTIRAPGSWPPRSIARSTLLRRNKLLERKHEELGHELEAKQEAAVPDLDAALDDEVGDDLLRLIFIACHPVLSTEARVALTLAAPRRADHRRDRACVPGPRADDRAADRPGQADAGREARSRSRCRAGADLDRATVVGARGDLSRLQRGLLGDRRRRLDAAGALRGRAAARTHPGRARSEGSPKFMVSSL